MAVRGADLPRWAPVAVLLAASAFLFLVRDILPPFILAVALAYALNPLVSWLERFARLPRTYALLLFYFFALTPLAALWFWFAPRLVAETQGLADALPEITSSLFIQFFGRPQIDLLGQTVTAEHVAQYLLATVRHFFGVPQNAAETAGMAVEFVVGAFLIVVVLAYAIIDGDRFLRAVLITVPSEQRLRVRLVAKQVDRLLLPYIWALVLLALLAFATTWLVFGALYRLPYALPVALGAGFLGLIPVVGPFVAGAFAAAVGLGLGNLELAIEVVVFYFLFRQLEHEVVVPRTIGRRVAPHPAIIIFAVVAGAALAGVLGVILAIPVAAALKVVQANWFGVAEEGKTAALNYDAR